MHPGDCDGLISLDDLCAAVLRGKREVSLAMVAKLERKWQEVARRPNEARTQPVSCPQPVVCPQPVADGDSAPPRQRQPWGLAASTSVPALSAARRQDEDAGLSAPQNIQMAAQP